MITSLSLNMEQEEEEEEEEKVIHKLLKQEFTTPTAYLLNDWLVGWLYNNNNKKTITFNFN